MHQLADAVPEEIFDFLGLHRDLQHEVLSFMSTNELLALRCVNRAFATIVQTYELRGLRRRYVLSPYFH